MLYTNMWKDARNGRVLLCDAELGDALVGIPRLRHLHLPWRVRLYNPNCIILDPLALQPLHLESDTDIKSAVSAGLNTREKLKISPHECITASRERAERDFLAFIRLAIQESKASIVDPSCPLPKCLILRSEQNMSWRRLIVIVAGSALILMFLSSM